VLQEVTSFTDRNQKILNLLKLIVKLEKDVAKVVKDSMTTFLSYRKNYLGIDSKGEEDLYGQVALCEDKVDNDRVNYFNKMLLKREKIETLCKLFSSQLPKNNWEVIVGFLNTPKQSFIDLLSA
jgi:hypothetical protein